MVPLLPVTLLEVKVVSLELSPQSMVPLKSAGRAPALASVKAAPTRVAGVTP